MRNLQQELADVETKLRRWQSRLKRASNEVSKWDKKRRRIQLALLQPKDQTVVATVKATMPTERAKELELEIQKDPVPAPVQAQAAPEPDGLDIPEKFRRPYVDVDKLKAERLAREAADKAKVPLTDRAAMALIRQKPKRRAGAGKQ